MDRFINTEPGLRASEDRIMSADQSSEAQEEPGQWISASSEASFDCSQSEKTAGGNCESRF